MSVKERLIMFIHYKKLSKSEFCRIIGVSSAFVSSMRVSIQPDKIESITMNFPDLNTGWLLTGEGEMLRDGVLYSPKENYAIDYKAKYYDALEELRDVRRQLDELKSEKLNKKEDLPSAPVIARDAEAS